MDRYIYFWLYTLHFFRFSQNEDFVRLCNSFCHDSGSAVHSSWKTCPKVSQCINYILVFQDCDRRRCHTLIVNSQLSEHWRNRKLRWHRRTYKSKWSTSVSPLLDAKYRSNVEVFVVLLSSYYLLFWFLPNLLITFFSFLIRGCCNPRHVTRPLRDHHNIHDSLQKPLLNTWPLQYVRMLDYTPPQNTRHSFEGFSYQ